MEFHAPAQEKDFPAKMVEKIERSTVAIWAK